MNVKCGILLLVLAAGSIRAMEVQRGGMFHALTEEEKADLPRRNALYRQCKEKVKAYERDELSEADLAALNETIRVESTKRDVVGRLFADLALAVEGVPVRKALIERSRQNLERSRQLVEKALNDMLPLHEDNFLTSSFRLARENATYPFREDYLSLESLYNDRRLIQITRSREKKAAEAAESQAMIDRMRRENELESDMYRLEGYISDFTVSRINSVTIQTIQARVKTFLDQYQGDFKWRMQAYDRFLSKIVAPGGKEKFEEAVLPLFAGEEGQEKVDEMRRKVEERKRKAEELKKQQEEQAQADLAWCKEIWPKYKKDVGSISGTDATRLCMLINAKPGAPLYEDFKALKQEYDEEFPLYSTAGTRAYSKSVKIEEKLAQVRDQVLRGEIAAAECKEAIERLLKERKELNIWYLQEPSELFKKLQNGLVAKDQEKFKQFQPLFEPTRTEKTKSFLKTFLVVAAITAFVGVIFLRILDYQKKHSPKKTPAPVPAK